MINSTYISKNEDTGIYYILVNTENRWNDYQINWKSPDIGKLSITFYYTEEMPGIACGEIEDESTEDFNVEEGFNAYDYTITSLQVKDQIVIMCTPKSLILNKFFKEI